MANENWHLLADKLRSYRPAVDADAAWRAAQSQLAATPPRRLSWWQLLGWKTGELLALLLFLWAWGATSAGPRQPSMAPEIPPQAYRPAPESTAPVRPEPQITTRAPLTGGGTSDILPPATTDRGGAVETFASAAAQREEQAPQRAAATIPAATEPLIAAHEPSFGTVETAAPPRLGAVAALPVVDLRPLPAAVAIRPEWRSVARAGSSGAAAVSWALVGGVGQTPAPRLAPLAGVQMRLPLGSGQAVVLGAAYQRVRGMDLHWRQAEYHKDFGYPTGNAVERWLDSYGAWEYSIDYHQKISGRLGIHTGLQLTVLQERGLRERVQGSDFFLGSSRRSLVDRDFGLRLGLDYRLTRHVALYAQYLQGISDISPDYLYQDEARHRHGGLRVGLRLMLFNKLGWVID